MANRNRSNPFDSDPFSSGSRNSSGNDPFSSGSRNSSGNDPFSSGSRGSSGNDPFASGGRNSGGNDPFSSGSRNSSGNDPFSSGSRGSSGSDPFSSGSQSSSGNDPFAPGRRNSGYDPFSPPAQNQNMPPANDPYSRVPAQQGGDTSWPVRNNSDRRTRLAGIGNAVSGEMSANPNEDIWVIRAIQETDLTNYGFIQKLMQGIPLFCNYMYTMTLVRADNSAHSMAGSAKNAVVYGKMTHSVLQVQDRIRVSGKEKRTGLVVDRIVSVDSGMEIPISRLWQDPNKQKGYGTKGGGPLVLLIVAAVILLMLIQFLGKASGVDFSRILTIIIVVVVILAYLKVTNFAALRSPLFTKVMIGVLLCFIVLYVPGGQQVGTLFLVCLGIWLMFKSILK